MGMHNARRQNNRRSKREDAAKAAVETLWSPPAEDECDVPEILYYDVSETSRIVTRTTHKDGQLVDYAIMHNVARSRDEWETIARIDCCHQEVHRHTVDSGSAELDSRKVLRKIRSQRDVVDSYDDAYMEIFMSTDENERKWRSGRSHS